MRRLFVFSLAILLALDASGQKRKKKKEDVEPITQTLPLLADPPAAIAAETDRLVFRVSPLSAKGLLSQQVRDALKALIGDSRGSTIVKLRAFVSGTGDLRRVQTIVSEVFTDRKLPLPVLSTIQVGALPMEGAQVVIESIGTDKKTVNPAGLAFLSGQQAKTVSEAVAKLQTAASAAGMKPASALRVTCFLSSLDSVQAARTEIAAAFPAAAADYIQPQRLALEPMAECEAVGRLETPPGSLVVIQNDSQAALVNAPKVVFTGTQMAFGEQDNDLRLAFERLKKGLDSTNVSYKDVFWSSVYPLTRPIAEKTRIIRFDFLDRARPPASTQLLFEGLPSLDATYAVEVIAAAGN
jgi:enamine deaminase RidA (YjgF/YER057c/UK114 family)